MLFGRVREPCEGVELGDVQLPLARAVERESVQLAYWRRARGSFGEGAQDALCVGEALALERLGGLVQARAEFGDVARAFRGACDRVVVDLRARCGLLTRA